MSDARTLVASKSYAQQLLKQLDKIREIVKQPAPTLAERTIELKEEHRVQEVAFVDLVNSSKARAGRLRDGALIRKVIESLDQFEKTHGAIQQEEVVKAMNAEIKEKEESKQSYIQAMQHLVTALGNFSHASKRYPLICTQLSGLFRKFKNPAAVTVHQPRLSQPTEERLERFTKINTLYNEKLLNIPKLLVAKPADTDSIFKESSRQISAIAQAILQPKIDAAGLAISPQATTVPQLSTHRATLEQPIFSLDVLTLWLGGVVDLMQAVEEQLEINYQDSRYHQEASMTEIEDQKLLSLSSFLDEVKENYSVAISKREYKQNDKYKDFFAALENFLACFETIIEFHMVWMDYKAVLKDKRFLMARGLREKFLGLVQSNTNNFEAVINMMLAVSQLWRGVESDDGLQGTDITQYETDITQYENAIKKKDDKQEKLMELFLQLAQLYDKAMFIGKHASQIVNKSFDTLRFRVMKFLKAVPIPDNEKSFDLYASLFTLFGDLIKRLRTGIAEDIEKFIADYAELLTSLNGKFPGDDDKTLWPILEDIQSAAREVIKAASEEIEEEEEEAVAIEVEMEEEDSDEEKLDEEPYLQELNTKDPTGEEYRLGKDLLERIKKVTTAIPTIEGVLNRMLQLTIKLWEHPELAIKEYREKIRACSYINVAGIKDITSCMENIASYYETEIQKTEIQKKVVKPANTVAITSPSIEIAPLSHGDLAMLLSSPAPGEGDDAIAHAWSFGSVPTAAVTSVPGNVRQPKEPDPEQAPPPERPESEKQPAPEPATYAAALAAIQAQVYSGDIKTYVDASVKEIEKLESAGRPKDILMSALNATRALANACRDGKVTDALIDRQSKIAAAVGQHSWGRILFGIALCLLGVALAIGVAAAVYSSGGTIGLLAAPVVIKGLTISATMMKVGAAIIAGASIGAIPVGVGMHRLFAKNAAQKAMENLVDVARPLVPSVSSP